MNVHSQIIQGGMGAGVSGWRLAQAVSRCGCLGVVSGTALAIILARRLQGGDPGGHMARAAARFPLPSVVQRVFDCYFIPGGKAEHQSFKPVPLPTQVPGPLLTELTVLANFVEVALAKENHDGLVGINYLEKIQLPTLPSIFGAMLAGVDYVLMGAGIPRAVPGVLDAFAQGASAQIKLDVEQALAADNFQCEFDPAAFFEGAAPRLKRPLFLAIISSDTLAAALVRKSTGKIDGFIVEGATAGGHNAPPRGVLQLNAIGEPIYGSRDVPDLEKIKRLGLPFWLAGSFGSPEKLSEALGLGAAGIQVGTPFAFCQESDLEAGLKQRIIALARSNKAVVFTDPIASPTGFPFKVLSLENSLSDPLTYASRSRVCDLGYLRHPYRRADGTLGYRCPAEPVEDFLAKGGLIEECEGRKCVCNGLMATIGLPQVLSSTSTESPLITAGDDIANLNRFLKPDRDSYTAAEVIDILKGRQSESKGN
jgi:nitronate monooxygenase